MTKVLKVLNVESLKDKRDNKYNKIELSTPDFMMVNGQKVRTEPKTQNIVKWPKSYLPSGEPQYGHDLKVGESVAGDIVTIGNLLPYNIVDPSGAVTRQADSATHVVLGDSSSPAFAVATRKEFESRGKFLNDGTNEEKYAAYWGFEAETEAAPVESSIEGQEMV
jgi:hypothetical protein